MKKQLITASLILCALITKAQPDRRQPPSMEDKIKHTNEFFQKEVGITAAKQKEVSEVFKSFFVAEDKVRKENPPPPPPAPPAKVKASMDKLIQERDAKLKQILTAEEFAKFKAKEKQMHPPPPPPPQN